MSVVDHDRVLAGVDAARRAGWAKYYEERDRANALETRLQNTGESRMGSIQEMVTQALNDVVEEYRASLRVDSQRLVEFGRWLRTMLDAHPGSTLLGIVHWGAHHPEDAGWVSYEIMRHVPGILVPSQSAEVVNESLAADPPAP